MSLVISRFVDADFRYWAGRVGDAFDPTGPAGLHSLCGGTLDVVMQVGLYVAIEHPATPLYIGKVCRRDVGIRRRLQAHRQDVATWDGVWLIPLRQGTPDELVRMFELGMIRRHQPRDNVIGRSW